MHVQQTSRDTKKTTETKLNKAAKQHICTAFLGYMISEGLNVSNMHEYVVKCRTLEFPQISI